MTPLAAGRAPKGMRWSKRTGEGVKIYGGSSPTASIHTTGSRSAPGTACAGRRGGGGRLWEGPGWRCEGAPLGSSRGVAAEGRLGTPCRVARAPLSAAQRLAHAKVWRRIPPRVKNPMHDVHCTSRLPCTVGGRRCPDGGGIGSRGGSGGHPPNVGPRSEGGGRGAGRSGWVGSCCGGWRGRRRPRRP